MEHLEVKAALTAGDRGQIAGYASLFGRPADAQRDVVRAGAFTKSLSAELPQMLAEHRGEAIGAWEEVIEDDMGLRVRGRLDLTSPAGRKAYDDVASGRRSGLSIGYHATKTGKDADGARILEEITLVEISVVENPASSRARVLSVKSEEGAMPEDTKTEDQGMKALAAQLSDLEKKTDLAPLVDRLDKLETKMNRANPGDDEAEKKAEATAERKAFAAYLRVGDAIQESDKKALNESSDPQGGYLAPAELSSEVIRDLVEFSPIRSVASVRGTTAPSTIYPTRGDLTNAQWVGETQTRASSTITFGQKEVVLREMATFVDISNRLLADAPQAETEVRAALAEDFGKKEATAFVWGQGALEPEGFMRNTDIEHTLNGHATNLSADQLITLLYALPATYRNRGAWAMNGTTLGLIRKLKDGQGNFLWQPSYQAGQPETILGRPVVEMVDMPDVEAGAFPIIYGDWQAYRILDRTGLDVLVDPYTQRTNGLTRIHANRRVGGGVLQAARFRKLKMATS